MGRLSTHSKCLDFFLLSFRLGRGEVFFFCLCSQHVPFKFPMDSHQVPICSPGSQCVPQGCSQQHLALIPKSSPSQLYGWAKGGGTSSFHRIFIFVMGQSNWLIQLAIQASFFSSLGTQTPYICIYFNTNPIIVWLTTMRQKTSQIKSYLHFLKI